MSLRPPTTVAQDFVIRLAMLLLNGEMFASGLCEYFDSLPDRTELTAKIYVQIALQEVDYPVLAQLDTGAAYSVLDRDVAEAAHLFGIDGERVTIQARSGTFDGILVKVSTKLVADIGDSLDLEGTFFISKEWVGGNFIGYVGFLDSIRSAIDPGPNHFFFGEMGRHR